MPFFEEPKIDNYNYWMYKVFYNIGDDSKFISWDGDKANLKDGRSLVILNKRLSPEYYPRDKRDRYWIGGEGDFPVTVDGATTRISSISTIHRVIGRSGQYKIHIDEFSDDRLYRNKANNLCYFYMDRDDLEDHKKRYDNQTKGLVLGVNDLDNFEQLYHSDHSERGGRKKRTQTRTRKLTRTRKRTRRQKRTTRIMRLPRNLPRRRFDLL